MTRRIEVKTGTRNLAHPTMQLLLGGEAKNGVDFASDKSTGKGELLALRPLSVLHSIPAFRICPGDIV